MSVTREQVVDDPDARRARLRRGVPPGRGRAATPRGADRRAGRAHGREGDLAGRPPRAARRAAFSGAPRASPRRWSASRRQLPPRRLPAEEAAEIAGLLLDDEDAGVRKTVLHTVEARFGRAVPPVLAGRLAKLATSDPAPFVRTLAGQLMAR